MIEKIETLEKRIEEDTASLTEIIEWLTLTSNGDPINEQAINLLKLNLSSSYGDGFYDGFIRAQTIEKSGKDLADYKENSILEMSEWAEAECTLSKRNRTEKDDSNLGLKLFEIATGDSIEEDTYISLKKLGYVEKSMHNQYGKIIASLTPAGDKYIRNKLGDI